MKKQLEDTVVTDLYYFKTLTNFAVNLLNFSEKSMNRVKFMIN